MPITNLGSDQQSLSNVAGSMTLTLPTHAADDFGLVFCKCDEAGTVPSFSITTGWTQLFETNETSGRDRVTAVFYRKFTSSSETDPVVDIDVNEQRGCILEVFRGVDTTTPFDAASPFYTKNDASNNANPTNPSIVTNTDNAAVVLFHNYTHNDHTVGGEPSGYTLSEFLNTTSNNHEGCASAYDLDVGTAGTISPGAWTHTASPTNVSEYTCVTIALRPAAGGSDTEVSATTAALTLTTYAATVSLDVDVQASAAALSLTTYPATISLDVEVQAGVASLTLTTYPASITYDRDVQAGVAGLTLTTYPATITYDKDVQASVAALTLTTYPASIDLGVNIEATAAALTLTTYPATITYDKDVQAGTAALTLTTYPATVSLDIDIQASTAALSVTTYPATITYDVEVQAGVAALTLTTYPASIQLGVNVEATTAALTLTTYPATIGKSVNIEASLASLTLTTYPASIYLVPDIGEDRKHLGYFMKSTYT